MDETPKTQANSFHRETYQGTANVHRSAADLQAIADRFAFCLEQELGVFFEQVIRVEASRPSHLQIVQVAQRQDSKLLIQFDDTSRDRRWYVSLSRRFLREILNALFGLPSFVSNVHRIESFNSFERRLAKRLGQVIARAANAQWQNRIEMPWEVRILDNEESPESASTVSFNWLLIPLDLRIGERSGTMELLIPSQDVNEEPALCGSVLTQEDVSRWPEHAVATDSQSGLDDRVAMIAEIVASTLPERDLQDLRVGDILATDVSCDSPVDLRLNGTLRFKAIPGNVERKKAVRITEDLLKQG